jgi:antitoxin YefM
METVHLLSSPANAAHLATSIAQARSGQAQAREIIETVEAGEQKVAKPEVHG